VITRPTIHDRSVPFIAEAAGPVYSSVDMNGISTAMPMT
jgi:hypothetical protein